MSEYIGRNIIHYRNEDLSTSECKVTNKGNYTFRASARSNNYFPIFFIQFTDYFELKKGNSYTLQLEVRGGFEEDNQVLIATLGSTAVQLSVHYTQSTEWKKIIGRFKATDTFPIGSSKIGIYIRTCRVSIFGNGIMKDQNIDWIEVRNIKLEEGSSPTPWCPALEDCEVDFIKPNLINGTSNRWSDWITPIPLKSNICSVFISESNSIRLDKGKRYVSLLEVEYDNLTFPNQGEGEQSANGIFHYGIHTQGAVNDDWTLQSNNPFDISLMSEGGTGIILNGRKRYVLNRTPQINVDFFDAMFRVDNAASGSYRYRMVTLKEGDLNNPIWCKSEMDVANPNLNSSIRDNTDYSRDGTITPIIVTDAPNPYITEGLKIVRTGNIGNNFGFVLAYNRELDREYTASILVRGKGKLDFGVYNPSFIGLKNIQIPSETEWTKFEFTFTTSNNNLDYHVNILLLDKDSWCEVCGMKIEEGNKATTYVPYIYTNNLLLNTNEGLVVKPVNVDIDEYTFESDIPHSNVKKVQSLAPTDSCYVNEVEDAPFNVTKSVHITAINKDIELNKNVFIENNDKELTFSLYLKGTGKVSMYFIPKEKEINGLTYGGYKIGNDFEATDEWTLCSISSHLFDEFNISIIANKGSEVELCAFKLEEGNKVSDWCDYQEPEEFMEEFTESFPEPFYSFLERNNNADKSEIV